MGFVKSFQFFVSEYLLKRLYRSHSPVIKINLLNRQGLKNPSTDNRNTRDRCMHKLLEDSPGKKMFFLGNEAIARGALEAGVAVSTTYRAHRPLKFP